MFAAMPSGVRVAVTTSGEREPSSRGFGDGSLHNGVVDPQQERRGKPDGGNEAPHPVWTAQDVSEVMDGPPTEPTSDQGTDRDRKEGVTHVGALLTGGREP